MHLVQFLLDLTNFPIYITTYKASALALMLPFLLLKIWIFAKTATTESSKMTFSKQRNPWLVYKTLLITLINNDRGQFYILW